MSKLFVYEASVKKFVRQFSMIQSSDVKQNNISRNFKLFYMIILVKIGYFIQYQVSVAIKKILPCQVL